MRDTSMRIRRGVAALLVALGLLAAFPSTAGANHIGLITCDASGIVEFTANPPGPAASPWSILGKGSCQGDMHGTYSVEFSGTGSSDTLGRCGGTDFVQNLVINVTVTLTSFQTLLPKILTESWEAPLTTFPIASPFLIFDGGLQGGGTFFTRVLGQCPPEGTPVAKFVWARML